MKHTTTMHAQYLFVAVSIWTWLHVDYAYAYLNNNLQPVLTFSTERIDCPKDGVPVCCRMANNIIPLPNKCYFNAINKKAAQFHNSQSACERMPLHYCLPKCNFKCPTTYRPICAFDEISGTNHRYRNICEMAREACLAKSDTSSWSYRAGVCKRFRRFRRKPKTSRTPCPKSFDPVCGVLYGVKSTFLNGCLLFEENVKTGNDWKPYSAGVCGEDIDRFTNLSRKPKFPPR